MFRCFCVYVWRVCCGWRCFLWLFLLLFIRTTSLKIAWVLIFVCLNLGMCMYLSWANPSVGLSEIYCLRVHWCKKKLADASNASENRKCWELTRVYIFFYLNWKFHIICCESPCKQLLNWTLKFVNTTNQLTISFLIVRTSIRQFSNEWQLANYLESIMMYNITFYNEITIKIHINGNNKFKQSLVKLWRMSNSRMSCEWINFVCMFLASIDFLYNSQRPTELSHHQ